MMCCCRFSVLGDVQVQFSSMLANGTPTSATDTFLTCVCHVELSWKNFTPLKSTPSIYTVKCCCLVFTLESDVTGIPFIGAVCDALAEHINLETPSTAWFLGSVSFSFSFFFPSLITVSCHTLLIAIGLNINTESYFSVSFLWRLG